MCPPQLALQIEPESFATEARSDTAILTSEEQGKGCAGGRVSSWFATRARSSDCASEPFTATSPMSFVMCDTQSVRAGSRHDLSNAGPVHSGWDIRAINLRV